MKRPRVPSRAYPWIAVIAGCSALGAPAPAPPPPAVAIHAGPGGEVEEASPELGAAATEEHAEHSDPEVDVIEDAAADEEASEHDDVTVAPLVTHPLDGWSPERIAEAVKNDISQLGSLSIGQPSAGALLGGVRAEASALYVPVAPEGAWGTTETLEYLERAIQRVHAQFPSTPPLYLGHISDRDGGPLSPHISHQSGRDVDISFYYTHGARWYARATRDNLDVPRTWAFVRALVTETDVEMILIDHSIQPLLRHHALEIGEDPEWVESIFKGVPGKLRPIVRHAPGHATHIHVRFYNPIAQESARRCHQALVKSGKIPALATFIRHRARRGDTLGKLAKKYGVSVQAIKAANGLRTSLIREKREYRIPVRARAAPPPATPLRFPPRRLPPDAVGKAP